MTSWLRGITLALVFALVGAFAASLWLELRHETRPAVEAPGGIWNGRRVRVEVLNGAGVDGLARRVTDRLRDRGFDVVYYGNAERFGYDTSVALARLDSLEPARRVANALGLRSVRHEPAPDLYLDVTVILGTDLSRIVEDLDSVAADATPAREGWWARLGRVWGRLWPD